MVAIEPVMQEFDRDLANHYERLIDEEVLPAIGIGSEGEVYSTGSHAIKVYHDSRTAGQKTQAEYTTGKVLEIIGVKAPRALHKLTTPEGKLALVMSNLGRLSSYDELNKTEQRSFDNQLERDIATMREHGLTVMDINRNFNYKFDKKTQRGVVCDLGAAILN